MTACSLLQRMWQWSSLGRHRAFGKALCDPARAQEALLRGYLKDNTDTTFGRRFRFDLISNAKEFQNRVPLSTYDNYVPWIDRIRAGESGVLTREPVLRLVPSSGSTAACKLIPYTAGLLREFQRAIAPWIVSLFETWPDVRNGPAYWSVSPAFTVSDGRPSAVPIGFDDDSAYLGPIARRLVDHTLAVPSAVRHITDIHTFRYVTLLYLLRSRELRLVSVWHPSYFTLLLDSLQPWRDRLAGDLNRGTLNPPGEMADDLRRSLAHGLRPSPSRAAEIRDASKVCEIWPRLRLVSFWADGPSAGAASELATRLPGVAIQAKGLIATEAIVTLPFGNHRPLAVRSHFFEFLDESERAYTAEELDVGGEYAVVVTTGGGLYRYRLQDRVRVTGRLERAPVLSFLGKEDHYSDFAGEKLSEGFVAEILRTLFAALQPDPVFAMLAPDHHGSLSGYTLYVQRPTAIPTSLPVQLEALLNNNPHYEYCVRLGQLRSVRCFVVEHGAHETYIQHRHAAGQGLGQIKSCRLSAEAEWSNRFVGCYLADT